MGQPPSIHKMTDEQKRALAIAKITALNANIEQVTSEQPHSEVSSYYDSEEDKPVT